MSFLYGWGLAFLVPLFIYLVAKRVPRGVALNMRWGALALLIIALARPIVSKPQKSKIDTIHSIVIALDSSFSMRADDIKPNRMVASKEAIFNFLKENKKEQIALIAFTINPLLLSPFTTDHYLVSVALKTLKENYILTKGTSLKRLIEKVAKFPNQEKLLVIFSDGGDEDIDDELVSFIKEKNIKILTIAMASLRGSPIKLDSGELLRDKQNHIVISKLNSQIYKLGEVIKFSSPKETSEVIESWIEKQSISKDIKRKSSSYSELFFIPTFLALVLIFISSTKYIKRFIWLLALLGMNLEAYDIFDSFYLHQAYIEYQNAEYNNSLESISNIETKSLESELIRANIHYRLQHYKVAKSIWSSIKTTNPKIKQQIFYNLGNCEAKRAYYSKAIDYYIKAFAFGEDEDILHNLEVVVFQRDKYNSKLGTTNPKSAQKSSSGSNNNSKTKKEESKSSKQGSSSGDSSSKSSKTSTTAIKPTQTDSQSKKEMSSKAYELINEGYINEERPW